MSQSVEIMSQNRVHMSMPGPIVFLERGVAYGSDWPLLRLTSSCSSRTFTFSSLGAAVTKAFCVFRPLGAAGWRKTSSKPVTGCQWPSSSIFCLPGALSVISCRIVRKSVAHTTVLIGVRKRPGAHRAAHRANDSTEVARASEGLAR